MVGGKRNFVDRRDHYYFNAGSGLFSIKKIEGNEKTNRGMGSIWGKNKKYAKQVKLTRLQYFRTGKKLAILWLPENIETKQAEQNLR